MGRLLRREGLYSSHLASWRKARRAGSLAGLSKRRGRKPKPLNPLAKKVVKLEREVDRLHDDLRKAHLILDVQGKVAGLLGLSFDDDNPFSEAHFKTLKYHPGFPDRFGSMEHSLSFSRTFFPWYNTEHRHSGISMLTPEDVHYGRGISVLDQRRKVLAAAFEAHQERFVRGLPTPKQLPQAVRINPPGQHQSLQPQGH